MKYNDTINSALKTFIEIQICFATVQKLYNIFTSGYYRD